MVDNVCIYITVQNSIKDWGCNITAPSESLAIYIFRPILIKLGHYLYTETKFEPSDLQSRDIPRQSC